MTDKTTDRDLGQVEGRVEMIVPWLQSVEKRLHAIEKKMWLIVGGGVALGTALTKIDWLELVGHAAHAAGLH